jgi:hypothetical protein
MRSHHGAGLTEVDGHYKPPRHARLTGQAYSSLVRIDEVEGSVAAAVWLRNAVHLSRDPFVRASAADDRW